MITDVLYSVNLYILFLCVKRFELSHVMDIALYKCYVLLLYVCDHRVLSLPPLNPPSALLSEGN